MEQLALSKSKVSSFLEALGDEYRVVAPRKIGPADVVFDEFEPGGLVPFDYVNSHLPPKFLFFPMRECLFTIEGTRHAKLLEPPAEKPTALFGLRSCDATAILYLARFFGERGFEDGNVMNRIRRSLRMTLACHAPGPDCFCVCCGGGPSLSTGFDIQFTDLGEILLAEVATEKGAAAVGKNPALFGPAAEEHLAARLWQLEQVDGKFQLRSYMAEGIKRISLDKIPSACWESWAEDCQDCGGCCHVCPTCSCFTMHDSWRGHEAFARERTWDACLYEGFTREASGHNPRPDKPARLKRRFFHKMSYQYMEDMGRHGCVGCGRCVATCMGGLDISHLLERIHDECR